MDEHDLLAIGLGDWCPPGREAHEYKSPLAFTDTVLSKDMADKAAFLFDKLHMPCLLYTSFSHFAASAPHISCSFPPVQTVRASI